MNNMQLVDTQSTFVHLRLPTPRSATCSAMPHRSCYDLHRRPLRLAARCAAGKGFGFGAPKKSAGTSSRKKGARQDVLPVWEADKKACPCGSGKAYTECCEQYINGEVAPTAEALMRSRFSAYVKGKIDYIVSTTHPDNPSMGGSRTPDGEHSATLYEDAYATWKRTGWQHLKILERAEGCSPDESFIKFVASFKFINQVGQRQKGNKLETLTERSRFVRGEDGRWLYIDGDTTWSENMYT